MKSLLNDPAVLLRPRVAPPIRPKNQRTKEDRVSYLLRNVDGELWEDVRRVAKAHEMTIRKLILYVLATYTASKAGRGRVSSSLKNRARRDPDMPQE